MKKPTGKSIMLDELLEHIWTLRESGRRSIEELIDAAKEEEDLEENIGRLEQTGFIEIRDKVISFTEKGEKRAEEIIRRHRLAERLFADLFDMEEVLYEYASCQFEHILSEEVVDNVCAFLGHPPLCPHGKPIPRGSCCESFTKEIKPVVVPLSELEPGEKGKIVFISPRYHDRMDKLVSLGVIPGTIVKMHQKVPSVVIRFDETDIAMEVEMGREIFVKKIK